MRKLLLLISLGFWLVKPTFAANCVWVVNFDFPITSVSADYLISVIQKANHEKVKALVVELDTPGGLLESTRVVVKEFLASKVPIVVYVSPSGARAASAGTFLVYAATYAAMAPGTHLGAAHPVTLVGSEKKIMMKKILNDTLAWAKNIANLRHRNYEVIKEAILKCRTYTEKEALRLGAIDFIAKNLKDLLKKLSLKLKLKGCKVKFLEVPLKYRLLITLTNPNLIYFLLMLGLAGLYFELSHPGAVFPGVIGSISLMLALVGLSILPVSYAGVGLILLSGLLFFLETRVPSHGVLSIGGLVSLFLGSIMLFKGLPEGLQINDFNLYGIFVVVSILLLWVSYLAVKTLRKKPISGSEGLIGKVGEVLEEITPQRPGKVFVEGEIWKAEADTLIPKGSKVIVLSKDGFNLKVKTVEE